MPKLKPSGHTTRRTSPTPTYYGGMKTKSSVAEVVALLKKEWREQKLLLGMAQAERRQNAVELIPTRKPVVTKLNTFNTVLSKCPGGARDEAKTGAHAAYLKQIAHPETGCVAIEPETNRGAATLRRLANTARNANTTQGNYNATRLT